MADLKLGKLIIEGKTKTVHELVDRPGQVLLQSKDRITCGDGARAHDMEGKAALATNTNCNIFKLLNSAGIKTAFIEKHNETSFVGYHCDMIPIEWVTRRVATGSFLKRNVGVKEGYRFNPPKLETFFKDDENHDPQWSEEQLIAAELKAGGFTIGRDEVAIMSKTTVAVFEILERAWAAQNVSLIDMKIEYGIKPDTGEILLADVIDNDSWRIWPAGDRRLMKDKQVYRELKEVTASAMEDIKKNFAWAMEKTKELVAKPHARAVVIMGSPTDTPYCEKIQNACRDLGVPCELRVCSAHKATDEALHILAEYEGEGIPTVFIAVAGRSNGLGPVLSGNATWPVINCPPVSADWGAQDIWSSLRLPSGLGCATVLSPDAASLSAAQILALSDHVIWARLRARYLKTWISLKQADKKARDDK